MTAALGSHLRQISCRHITCAFVNVRVLSLQFPLNSWHSWSLHVVHKCRQLSGLLVVAAALWAVYESKASPYPVDGASAIPPPPFMGSLPHPAWPTALFCANCSASEHACFVLADCWICVASLAFHFSFVDLIQHPFITALAMLNLLNFAPSSNHWRIFQSGMLLPWHCAGLSLPLQNMSSGTLTVGR